jgi:hypothetical protein
LEESRPNRKMNGEVLDIEKGIRHGGGSGAQRKEGGIVFHGATRVARSIDARRFVFWPRRGMQSRRALV